LRITNLSSTIYKKRSLHPFYKDANSYISKQAQNERSCLQSSMPSAFFNKT
jgi:hypothetical protein